MVMDSVSSTIKSSQQMSKARLSTEHDSFGLQPQDQPPSLGDENLSPASSRRLTMSSMIYTEQRMPARCASVIGSALAVPYSIGLCLASVEAPFAWRAAASSCIRTLNFCSSSRTNNCEARPYPTVARHEAVIGRCTAHPGRRITTICARDTGCCGLYPLILQRRASCSSNEI